MRAALLAVAACLAPATGARANDPPPRAGGPPRLELFAGAGAAWATHEDLRQLGLDAGPALEAGVALRLVPHVAVQASAGWLGLAHRNGVLRRTGNDPADPVEEVESELSFRAIPLLASVRGSAAFGRLEASALAGAGVTLVSQEVTWRSSVTGTSSWSFSDAVPALALGAGLSAAVAPHVGVAIDARYVAGTATFRGRSTSTAQGVDVTARVDTLAVAATIAWRP